MLEINRPDTNGPRRSRNTGTVCKLNWLGPGPLTALCWHSVARSTHCTMLAQCSKYQLFYLRQRRR